jgi:hypothetical protein
LAKAELEKPFPMAIAVVNPNGQFAKDFRVGTQHRILPTVSQPNNRHKKLKRRNVHNPADRGKHKARVAQIAKTLLSRSGFLKFLPDARIEARDMYSK